MTEWQTSMVLTQAQSVELQAKVLGPGIRVWDNYRKTLVLGDGETVGGIIVGPITPDGVLPPTERLLESIQTGIGMSGGMVATMLDSLTDGAYSTDYRRYLARLMRAQFGDGGPGWQGFNAGVANQTGAGFFKTDEYLYNDIGTLPDGTFQPTPFGLLSVDGKGIYTVNASGSAAFNWSPASRWKTARIFYEAGAGFGTTKWKYTTEPDSAARTLDCSVGSGLSFLNLSYTGDTAIGIVFFQGSGKLCFYGGDFVLDPKGFREGNFSQGGRWLSGVAAQDSARRRQWWSLLKPTLALLDGGMNDRMIRTPARHYSDWTTIVSDIQAGAPDCGILMIQSLEPADATTTYFRDYTAQKIRVAKENNLSYIDIRRSLGYYADAAANGLMNSDGVHPSDKGNRLKAMECAGALGLSRVGQDAGLTQWSGSGGDTTPPSPFGTLSAKPQINATGGQRKELYRLGLTNGFSTGNFSFRIAGQRLGTSAVDIVEVEVALTSANIVNEAYVADGQSATPTLRVIQRTLAGDGQTVELPVNVTTVNNQASIGVTPSFDTILNVSGKYELLNFYPVGQLVFENPTA